MVTDEDRGFARSQADEIYQRCVAKGWGLHCQIATKIGYKETMRRGLLAECSFAHEFGLPIRTDVFEYGDGGVDFPLPLLTPQGVRDFIVNVKAKSVRVSWRGLMNSGTHLRVPVVECRPLTIYVFATYLEATDDAEVLRWEWGATLIRNDERRVYPNSSGVVNYVRLFNELRDLRQLKDRMR